MREYFLPKDARCPELLFRTLKLSPIPDRQAGPRVTVPPAALLVPAAAPPCPPPRRARLRGRASAAPSRAEPSRAKPNRAEPHRVKSSRAAPSRAGPGRKAPNQAEPRRAALSRAEPGRAGTRRGATATTAPECSAPRARTAPAAGHGGRARPAARGAAARGDAPRSRPRLAQVGAAGLGQGRRAGAPAGENCRPAATTGSVCGSGRCHRVFLGPGSPSLAEVCPILPPEVQTESLVACPAAHPRFGLWRRVLPSRRPGCSCPGARTTTHSYSCRGGFLVWPRGQVSILQHGVLSLLQQRESYCWEAQRVSDRALLQSAGQTWVSVQRSPP